MAAPIDRSGSARRAAATLGALTVLAGCAALPEMTGPAEPLFRTEVGEIAGSLAPAPRAVWYVERRPVDVVRVGRAAAIEAEPPGPFARLARLLHLGSGARNSEPTAVVAAGLGFPTPSRAEVINLATGAKVAVRVEDEAPMSGDVIRLPASAALAIGLEPARPMIVAIRYLAPAVTYAARTSLRRALRGPAPVPPVLAQVAPPITTPEAPAPAQIVRVAAITPAPLTLEDLGRALRPEQAAPGPSGEELRIQVGAYASLANARLAAGRLRAAGDVDISPLRRGRLTLYRVSVDVSGGGREAARLRERLAEMGFPGAFLVSPL